jgi:hypothetical protein
MPIAAGRWRLLSRSDFRRGKRSRKDRRKMTEVRVPVPPPVEPIATPPTGVGSRQSKPGVTSPLAEAQQRLWHAQELVARQTELVFEIRRNGRSSEEAERLLRTFHDTLWELKKSVAALEIRARKDA